MAMSFGSFATRVVATIVVAADGTGDTTDIAIGISMLPVGGGVVYVKEGTYTITSVITITSDNISINGAGKSTIVYLADNSNCHVFSLVNADNVTISNLQIDGNKDYNEGAFYGVRIDVNSDRTILRGCYIHDCARAGVHIAGDSASIAENIIDSCGTEENSGHGGILTVAGSENCSILYNEITSCYYAGIDAVTLNTPHIISFNRCIDNHGYGIRGWLLLNSSLIGNTCSNNDLTGILLVGAAACTITGNIIYHNTGHGIWVYPPTERSTINANTCASNYIVGILIEDTDCINNIVSDNIVVYNEGGQIEDNGTGTLVTDNITT